MTMTALIYQLFDLDAGVEIVLKTGLEAYDEMNEAKAPVKKYDMVIKNPKTGTIHKNPALDQLKISRRIILAPLARLERAAHGLGIRCSIHLSYRGISMKYTISLHFRQDGTRRLTPVCCASNGEAAGDFRRSGLRSPPGASR